MAGKGGAQAMWIPEVKIVQALQLEAWPWGARGPVGYRVSAEMNLNAAEKWQEGCLGKMKPRTSCFKSGLS